MEIVVAGLVGVLAALGCDGLLSLADGPVAETFAEGGFDVRANVRTALQRAMDVLEQFERAMAKRGILSPRKRAERTRVEAEMPEAFGALAISLGSGLSLSQAMRYVGGHAQEPVRTEFIRVSALIACGVPATTALDELVGRLHAPGLDLVSLALKVSQRTGAPLAGLLAEAAQLVGDRIELARRLDVKTSQVRMSARLVACMPVVMVGFLTLFSSDFRAGVATVPGLFSVLIAFVLNVTAWSIIRSVMRVRL